MFNKHYVSISKPVHVYALAETQVPCCKWAPDGSLHEGQGASGGYTGSKVEEELDHPINRSYHQ